MDVLAVAVVTGSVLALAARAAERATESDRQRVQSVLRTPPRQSRRTAAPGRARSQRARATAPPRSPRKRAA
jgi:hypothetical protein